MTDTQPDFLINISHASAVRMFSKMTPADGEDYFRMEVSIRMGEVKHKRDEARRVKFEAEGAAQKAAELAKPLSKRGTREECGEEFNRLRRLYNLSWAHEYDLESMGGIIISAYSGAWLGTTHNKDPRNCLEILENAIALNLIGEPFVGPLYEPADEEDDE